MAIDRLNLRHHHGQETISLDPPRQRGRMGLTFGVRVEPDDTLDAGYQEAYARLDEQSLGRLLHWLRTGVALPAGDMRIPEPFAEGLDGDGEPRAATGSAHRATGAEERGEGICRTCCAPIWNEGGTVGHRQRDAGWSDRIERGGDSLVCFRAAHYRHEPLTGREAAVWDRAYELGATQPATSTTKDMP